MGCAQMEPEMMPMKNTVGLVLEPGVDIYVEAITGLLKVTPNGNGAVVLTAIDKDPEPAPKLEAMAGAGREELVQEPDSPTGENNGD